LLSEIRPINLKSDRWYEWETDVFKREGEERVYTTFTNEVHILDFGSREGEGEAILPNPLKKLIYYHLQLTFKCI
jgi:hypothetical protein